MRPFGLEVMPPMTITGADQGMSVLAGEFVSRLS